MKEEQKESGPYLSFFPILSVSLSLLSPYLSPSLDLIKSKNVKVEQLLAQIAAINIKHNECQSERQTFNSAQLSMATATISCLSCNNAQQQQQQQQ